MKLEGIGHSRDRARPLEPLSRTSRDSCIPHFKLLVVALYILSHSLLIFTYLSTSTSTTVSNSLQTSSTSSNTHSMAHSQQPPSPTSNFTCLLSGPLNDFLIYSGREQSQWLIDITHDICDPTLKCGLLKMWDVAGEMWRR